MMRFALFVLVLLPLSTGRGDESELDPSIFDGTGRETRPADPSESGGEAGGEPEKEPSSDPRNPGPPESPAEPETSESPMEGGGAVPEASPTPEDVGSATAPAPEENEAMANEGTPIPAAPSESRSRAGETFRPSERIPPGQAVDFPWDI